MIIGDKMLFRKAILMVHGFAGGTYDQEYLAHRLELIRNFDVYSFTLAGHDGLFKNNMKEKEWMKSAENMAEFLINNGYRTIYVIGHSMGGVIAAYLANKYKEIKKIVFVSAAFRYMEFKNGNIDVIKSLKKTTELAKDYDKDEIITRLIKMPPSAIKEFMNLVKNNEKTLNGINIPTLIIEGNHDNLVPLETANFIYESIPTTEKDIKIYDGVTHDVFRGIKKEEITKDIIEFLRN